MFSCKEIGGLMDDYLSGELSPEERELFINHISGGKVCKRKTAFEEAFDHDLRSLPPFTPDMSLVRKVQNKVSGYHKEAETPVFSLFQENQRLFFNSGLAVIVVLLLALNVNFYVFMSRNSVQNNFAGQPKPAGERTVLQPVKFVLDVPDARESSTHSVAVVGDFNGWDPGKNKMEYDKKTDAWVLNLELKPGIYDYMYVINDKIWVADPNAGKLRDDGFGGQNSVLEL